MESGTTIHDGAVCLGTVEHPVRLQPQAELHHETSLGAFGFLNVGAIVYRGTTIGRFLSCGRGVEIGVAAHPLDQLSSHGFTVDPGWFPAIPGYGATKGRVLTSPAVKTEIGHDVWIGAQAIIRSGVRIGTGAVIGANAVVTQDVLPYEIVGGVPARRIRFRYPPEIRIALLRSEWWNLPFERIQDLPFHDVRACLADLKIPVEKAVLWQRLADLISGLVGRVRKSSS